MKTIGILITGHLPGELVDKYGRYGDLFSALLKHDNFRFERYFVVDGHLRSDPREADGWLITGSRHACYEDHSWIPPLEAFIRKARSGHIPMVGICFGHQIMAQAFGGKVEKFAGGWVVGPQEYKRLKGASEDTLIAWHQDQVLVAPDSAERLASGKSCENAILRYGDWGLSFQAHPEFTPLLFAELSELRAAQIGLDLADLRSRQQVGALTAQRVADEILEFFGIEGLRGSGSLKPGHFSNLP